MIKGIIIVNNNGQARICKFFQSVHEEGYSADGANVNLDPNVGKGSGSRGRAEARPWFTSGLNVYPQP